MQVVDSDAGSVSVLIVEDEWIVARGVQKTLEGQGYRVTGLAASAQDALRSVEQERPTLALVDIVILGPVDGIDLACQLRERYGIPSIFLTAHADDETLRRALRAAPVGYVVKPFQEIQLLSSLRLVSASVSGAESPMPVAGPADPLAGVSDVFPPAATPPGSPAAGTETRQEQFRGVARVLSEWAPRRPAGRQVLTTRELEVVRLLLANGRVSSIAEELQVSPYTVRNHLRAVYRKLGVHSQVELIRGLTRLGADDGPSGPTERQ